MSTRMDKTNSENVQSIAQIGMTKTKMYPQGYILQCVGLTGFYNLSYKKNINIFIYKGLL